MLFLFFQGSLFGQEKNFLTSKSSSKGSIYAYWGWNGSAYSKSNIHFKGNDYDFILSKVIAKDRQSKFGLKEYFGIQQLTIPQYNFRFGYYLNDKWDVSFGADHMKYVMVANQKVKINGAINDITFNYDGNYQDESIVLSPDFLTFEHTDGLNYLNLSLRRTMSLYQRNKFNLSGIIGVGSGLVVPRSNVQLLGNRRHDAWHLSGWGLDAMGALRLSIGKYFFIQSELKGGILHCQIF